VGTEKEKLNRALNYYLRSLRSLKHTYHLRIRFGGGYLVAKVAKNRRNASVFRFQIFSKAKPDPRRILATNASSNYGRYWSELLVVVAAAWLLQAAAVVGRLGCVYITRVSSIEVP
jgi:hypothetical protein